MNRFTLKCATVAMFAAVACSSAVAGGFMLSEQSVAGLGRSYAGAGIVGDDLSAVWYNPAGMSLLRGTAVQAGGVFVALDLPIKSYIDGATDNGRKYAVPIPNFFLTHQIDETKWFGLGLTVPFGMATEYDRNFSLRPWGMNAEIKVFDLNPSMAWKLTDKVTLGAGVSAQYVTAQVEAGAEDRVSYGRLNADGWAWGANLGLMWEPTEKLRFGLAYRSQVNHHVTGSYKIGQTRPGNSDSKKYFQYLNGHVDMSAPQCVTLTGSWAATEALRLSTTIRWVDWSSFEKLSIEASYAGHQLPQASKTIQNHWKDSWLFTVGADYTVNSAWTVRAGAGYEIAPIDDDKYRTTTIPDTDRLWLSVGATWHVNENLKGDFGLAWLHGIGDMGIYKPDNGQKCGEFDKLDATLIGAQFVYKF